MQLQKDSYQGPAVVKNISSNVDVSNGLTLHVDIENIVSNGVSAGNHSQDLTFNEESWETPGALQAITYSFALEDFFYSLLIEIAPVGGKLSQIKFSLYTEDTEQQPEIMNTTLGHIKITEA